MDFKKIDNILNKYFEGLTTLEEEKQLKDYFASEYIADQHYPYKALFGYFERAGQFSNPRPVHIASKTKNKRKYYAAAAALVIGLTFVGLIRSGFNHKINLHETATHIQVSNPNPEKQKEAVKEIKKFTRNVNEGIQKTGAISVFGTTTRKVFNIKNEKK